MCHLEYGLFGVCICLLLSDSETPWTAAHQAPLLWDSPGKNAGVGCHDLFQVIFPTQESNLSLLCLLHWQVDSFTRVTRVELLILGLHYCEEVINFHLA